MSDQTRIPSQIEQQQAGAHLDGRGAGLGLDAASVGNVPPISILPLSAPCSICRAVFTQSLLKSLLLRGNSPSAVSRFSRGLRENRRECHADEAM
jgi:hypothetical protein